MATPSIGLGAKIGSKGVGLAARLAQRGGTALPVLRQQAQELTALQQATGARDIEQDKPGIFRTLIDLLSRPNFALAGFAEEVFGEEPSVARGVKRALTEIFSGVGGIQGEKQAFGEVLEDLGVGTVTLADAFPALEGTWVGNFGSRGAAGLALDIFTDPLTYMTFGAGTGARISTSKGLRYLNAAGKQKFSEILQPILKKEAKALPGDIVGSNRAYSRAVTKAEKEFESVFKVGDDIAEEFLEPGGAKLFGAKVPGTDKLALGKVVNLLPESIAKPVTEGVGQMAAGFNKTMRGIFSPEGALANLPEPIRTRAVRFTNDFNRGSTAHRSHLYSQMMPLKKAYRKLAKKDKGIGERWHDIREGELTRAAFKSPEEEALFDQTMALYDSMGATLVEHGVLRPEQIRSKYIYHVYKNIEDLSQYHPRPGFNPPTGGGAPRFAKERKFDSFRTAQEESEAAHKLALKLMSRGEANRLYPVLEPEFDVFKNMEKYINEHSSALARKAWREEMVSQFGVKADDLLDMDPLFDEVAAKAVAAVTAPRRFALSRIKNVGKEPANHHNIAITRDGKTFGRVTVTDNGDNLVINNIESEFFSPSGGPNSLGVSAIREIKRELESMFPNAKTIGGKRVSGTRGKFGKPGDTSVRAGAPKGFAPENVPLRRAIAEGDIEKTLADKFGEDGARYVAVKSKATANEFLYLPKTVADSLDSINSRLFNTAEHREFGKLLKGFDWLNNNFKWGVYTIWPASATRDAYSNIFLSMLRIGVASLDPKRHIDAVAMMAGRNPEKVFANSGFTLGELSRMSKAFGVNVPGQVFVEQTGRFKLGAVRKGLTEKRALIENEARVMLWMEEIRRGADPRLAADTVGEFLFNYGEVSRVERDLFRRLIPFYTFTRKNVELQWKMLRRNPGMQVNQLKPFRGRESENEQMVGWEAEALKLRLDKDGKTLHVLTGIDLPLRNLDTVWAGGFGETGRRMMGMMTPVLKVPLEATVGRDLFTGGDLKRTRADTLGRIIEATNTPQGVRDWLGYTKTVDAAGRPRYELDGTRYALLVRSWMFSRAFSTSDRVFREYLNEPQLGRAMLDVLTGIRQKDLNMDEQERRKLMERIRQTEQSLVRRGEMREFSRAFTPKERR